MTMTQATTDLPASATAEQIDLNQRFAVVLSFILLLAGIGMSLAFSVTVWGAAMTLIAQVTEDVGDDLLNQIGILVTGPLAIWLTHDTRATWRKWACVFGLPGQPFWLVSTYDADVLFTGAWLRGFHHAWVKDWLQKKFDRQPAR